MTDREERESECKEKAKALRKLAAATASPNLAHAYSLFADTVDALGWLDDEDAAAFEKWIDSTRI